MSAFGWSIVIVGALPVVALVVCAGIVGWRRGRAGERWRWFE